MVHQRSRTLYAQNTKSKNTNLNHKTPKAHRVELFQAVTHVTAAIGLHSAVNNHEIVRGRNVRPLPASP